MMRLARQRTLAAELPGTYRDAQGNVMHGTFHFEKVLTRYRFRRIPWNLWRGIVKYHYPPCCVVAFTWWAFWHGSPGIRQNGDVLQWGNVDPGERRGPEYIRCHLHGEKAS